MEAQCFTSSTQHTNSVVKTAFHNATTRMSFIENDTVSGRFNREAQARHSKAQARTEIHLNQIKQLLISRKQIGEINDVFSQL